MTAIQQLEHYQVVADAWTEHNPSITVYVREDEWMEVGAWVYKHFDKLGGVSFLPHSDHNYKQAPYTEITKEEYEEAISKFPSIDWNAFIEHGDNTKHQQTLNCQSGVCDII
jgi:ribonucleoside-diphosphate reductase alpha chain